MELTGKFQIEKQLEQRHGQDQESEGLWFHPAGASEKAGGGRSCRLEIKVPRIALAGVQRATLDTLLCYLSVHLPAASADWVHRRHSINSH